MSTCRSCEEMPVCLEGLDRYSLQDDTYYFTLNCPPGYVCTGRDNVYLVCCDGEILHVIFPVGATQAEKDTALDGMITECLRRNCAATPDSTGPPGTITDPIQLYYNEPQSCTVYCPDGSPFTYTVPPGTMLGYSLAAANTAAKALACELADQTRICVDGQITLSGSSFKCCLGIYVQTNITASGSLGATNFWKITAGSLPPGMVLNGGWRSGPTTTISGTPTAVGIYTFTVKVTTPNGLTNQKSCQIVVAGITDASAITAVVGAAFTKQLHQYGFTAPFHYTVSSGSLPPGLTLNATTGLISGVVTASGTYTFSVSIVSG